MTRAAASSLNQYENNKLDLQVKNIPSSINTYIKSANDQIIRPPLSGMRDVIIIAFRDYDGILGKGAIRQIGRQERHSRDRWGGAAGIGMWGGLGSGIKGGMSGEVGLQWGEAKREIFQSLTTVSLLLFMTLARAVGLATGVL